MNEEKKRVAKSNLCVAPTNEQSTRKYKRNMHTEEMETKYTAHSTQHAHDIMCCVAQHISRHRSNSSSHSGSGRSNGSSYMQSKHTKLMECWITHFLRFCFALALALLCFCYFFVFPPTRLGKLSFKTENSIWLGYLHLIHVHLSIIKNEFNYERFFSSVMYSNGFMYEWMSECVCVRWQIVEDFLGDFEMLTNHIDMHKHICRTPCCAATSSLSLSETVCIVFIVRSVISRVHIVVWTMDGTTCALCRIVSPFLCSVLFCCWPIHVRMIKKARTKLMHVNWYQS